MANKFDKNHPLIKAIDKKIEQATNPSNIQSNYNKKFRAYVHNQIKSSPKKRSLLSMIDKKMDNFLTSIVNPKSLIGKDMTAKKKNMENAKKRFRSAYISMMKQRDKINER